MKNVLLLLVAIAFTGVLSAQTANEIVDQYLEKIGGVDKWQELKTMKSTASMSMQGMSFDGVIYGKYPDKQRVEVEINGMQLVQAYDGETAWWINPFMGSTTAQKMPPQMAEAMTSQKFESPFINYQDKGYTVELLGEKEVEGNATYEIRLGKADGKAEMYYFDKESLLPILMVAKGVGANGEEQTAATYFSDYQEIENGLVSPFSITVKVGGVTAQAITFKAISFNEELADDMFAFPKE